MTIPGSFLTIPDHNPSALRTPATIPAHKSAQRTTVPFHATRVKPSMTSAVYPVTPPSAPVPSAPSAVARPHSLAIPECSTYTFTAHC